MPSLTALLSPFLLHLLLLPVSQAAAEAEVVVGLPLQNLVDLEEAFWAVSTPGNPRYLQHLSRDQIAEIVKPDEAHVGLARRYLDSIGADESTIRVSALGDRMTATLRAGMPADKDGLLKSAMGEIFDFVIVRDGSGSPRGGRKPAARAGEARDGFPSSYSVGSQKKAYGIPEDLFATTGEVLQMVWGPGTFGYSPSSLRSFAQQNCPGVDTDGKVAFDPHSVSHGSPGGDNWGEGTLDVHMISCFGLNVTTWVSNTNTSSSAEEGDGFGLAMLDFLTELSGRKEEETPDVLSLSLGSLSAASCDLLCSEASKMGHSEGECREYMQEQRQVCMFLSQKQVGRISAALQILGTRGVTVFGSSGDGGSHFSFEPFEGGELASALNEISCKFQMPVFPTSSPYITSVGGTVWEGKFFPDPSKPVAWSRSGGGFSWEFPRADHQQNLVSGYLQNTKDLPPVSSYNQTNRAYPDISAVAVDGTSQSSPTVAGIFSLITDLRKQQGLQPLGFLGPRLYKNAEAYPGEAFQDVVDGNTATSCDNGFPAANGWDPVTGLGRPNWKGLVKHFAADDTL